jgi:hypothetical protein
MRKHLFVLTLALALVAGGWDPPIAQAVSCGSTTSTPALGLKKITSARGWYTCIDESFDLLDTALGVEFVSSTATAGAATTLTDTTQDWETNLWADDVVKITGGTGSGQARSIASNTATVLTVSSAWTTNPDATSTYKVIGGLGGTFLPLAGGTMTGKITLDADPTAALHAATKQYVDAGTFLPLGGGTMTGKITLDADPTANLHAATKQYVDNSLVNVKVGTFTRDTSLASGTQAVTGVGFEPVAVLFMGGEHNSDEYSWGADDGTNQKSFRINASLNWVNISGASISERHSSGNDYNGVVQSFDSDGFTIDWTRTGTPTGTLTIIYMAFR